MRRLLWSTARAHAPPGHRIVTGWLSDDQEAHVRVLCSTVDGAFTLELPGTIGLNPDIVRQSRNELYLAVEGRDPEGVDHVRAFQLDVYRPARRNVDLTGRSKLLVS